MGDLLYRAPDGVDVRKSEDIYTENRERGRLRASFKEQNVKSSDHVGDQRASR
jgi:hypothetical protein